jgi:hypothetical protein
VEQQFGKVAPGIVQYTTEVLFRDLWLRPDLRPRDRASSRKKIFVLTPAGRRGRERYDRLVRSIETAWAANYGREKVGRLRGLLETIVGRTPSLRASSKD